MSDGQGKGWRWAAAGASVVLALAMAMAGCDNGIDDPGESPDYERYLYMSDTTNGRIYTYDPEDESASSAALATAKACAGAVVFHEGKGYVAVGLSWSGDNDPGIYRFDPSDPIPSAARIAEHDLSAQYIAFDEATDTAWFTAAGSTSPADDGLYYFDASAASPAPAGPVTGTGGMYLQQLAMGADGCLYVARADYYPATEAHSVLKVDIGAKSLSSQTQTSASGTTAIAVGTFGGSSGVFVGNTGGTVDFLDSSGTLTQVAAVAAYRVLPISSSTILATDFSATYLIDLASSGTEELKRSSASFGCSDVAIKDGIVYLAHTNYSGLNSLYAFSAGGSAPGEPLSVMTSDDAIAGIGFYE